MKPDIFFFLPFLGFIIAGIMYMVGDMEQETWVKRWAIVIFIINLLSLGLQLNKYNII